LRFDLLVFPGQRLLMKPRGDLRVTAAARIGRWIWMPAYASPACVHAWTESGDYTDLDGDGC
jgi:hypothetical protein